MAQPVAATTERERLPVQVPPGFGAGQAMRIDHLLCPASAFERNAPNTLESFHVGKSTFGYVRSLLGCS